MRPSAFPEILKQEFATVELLLQTKATTRCVDALLLAWTKYEKQLRRLFSFLVFRHPAVVGDKEVDAIIGVMVKNRYLNPETLEDAIKALGAASIETLLGPRHAELLTQITRIRAHRNKLMHGQITGAKITSRQLERDVEWIAEWISTLAVAAQGAYGYDGLKRNTFRAVRGKKAITEFPFTSLDEFGPWLSTITAKKKR